MEKRNVYTPQFRIERHPVNHNELMELFSAVFSNIDVMELLHEEDEHMYEFDLLTNQIIEYKGNGLRLSKTNYFKDEEGIINIHTHPIKSLKTKRGRISSTGFPSNTDLAHLLRATVKYSEHSNTPVTSYIVGIDDDSSIRLTSYRISQEMLDEIYLNKKRTVPGWIDFIIENIRTAFTIVVEDKDKSRNFVKAMINELNRIAFDGTKLLDIYSTTVRIFSDDARKKRSSRRRSRSKK